MNDYLSDLYKRLSGKMKLGLQRSRQLMAYLHHPESCFRSIHIAGTNGKGSVTAITTSLLQACGYKTGRFTSPHLVNFNERIQIEGQPLSDDRIQEYLQIWQEELDKSGASFFEITTALAFAAFRDEHVDVAVVETGLGGRLDATTVLIPDVSVITRISYDHTQILGNTLTQIAGEKAGILKEGVPCVSCAQDPEVMAVLKSRHEDLLICDPGKIRCTYMCDQGMEISMSGYAGTYTIPLAGRHHLENIQLAVKAAEQFIGRELTEYELDAGLGSVNWPGRFQVLQTEDPICIYDVGHNPGGIAAVCAAADEIYPGKNISYLLGVMKDKQVDDMLDILLKHSRHVSMFPVASQRGFSKDDRNSLPEKYDQLTWYNSVGAALDDLLKTSADRSDVVIILGSHYPAGEIYTYFKDNNDGENYE